MIELIELNTFADGVRIAVNPYNVVSVKASDRNSCTLLIQAGGDSAELRVREPYGTVVALLTGQEP